MLRWRVALPSFRQALVAWSHRLEAASWRLGQTGHGSRDQKHTIIAAANIPRKKRMTPPWLLIAIDESFASKDSLIYPA